MPFNDIEVLARTIYGEARGEYEKMGGIASLIAVGNVIMNRLNFPRRFGGTIKEICLKPWQFSCWNEKDPNRLVISRPTIDHPTFALCREIAQKVSSYQWPDLTKGSNHYHTLALKPFPSWAKNQTPRVSLGHHIFYFIH